MATPPRATQASPPLIHTAPAPTRPGTLAPGFGSCTQGDASVPTTHPHRSRPYAIWDPSPRFVVDPLGRGCLTEYWTLTKDSPSYWSQMYYDGDPWGTGECVLHRILIGKGLGQTTPITAHRHGILTERPGIYCHLG